uniref:Aspartyl aminopeptidase n=1 Tax=Macrostomum lignano TaxID=282301 RepID=A0A1I8FAD9_9PLAT
CSRLSGFKVPEYSACRTQPPFRPPQVPSLAIHLNRTVNDEGFAPNKENHLAPNPLAADASGAGDAGPGPSDDTSAPPQRHPVGLLARIAEKLGCQPADILDWDLYLADTQPAAVTGLNGDFVSSPRLDNLLSCYSALTALIEAPGLESDPNCRVVCLYDHEEIAARRRAAGSALTLHFLRRLSQGAEFETAVPKSLLVSADVAHAVHPNYEEKHERKHRPSLFGGVVIKENANQRYATNCLTSSLLRECLRLSDPAAQLQDFDMACGSTIGPILAAKVGLPTIDVGSPIFGMHSIRETGAAAAPGQGVQLFSAFFKHFPALREAMETHPFSFNIIKFPFLEIPRSNMAELIPVPGAKSSKVT